ncbi:MAG: UDP-4-amino-4,6-dideoxy-N-acetyl-beta-L-altrosamine N-acetyltransferase [Gammaproteobacteria bacterium]|nr:UDP-4-amino-4,6-dideoxy-N-acetyl-beta-L-altrosamine N-acetyltransferase [Gammaproteobacteria bacterium]
MLREICAQDLDDILRWRNSSEVRQVMFTDHVISENEHLAWWDAIKKDHTRKCLICSLDGVDVGIVNYFDIDNNARCHWGFYLSSDLGNQLMRMKAWQSLEKDAIEYAFEILRCDRLICESFRFNRPVIEMHKRFGFEEVAIETKEKNGAPEEVVITELTSDKYYQKFDSHRASLVKTLSDAGQRNEYRRLSRNCVILGSSNLDFFSNAFSQHAAEYKINLSFAEVPYGQYMIQISDPESQLCKVSHDYVVFIERLDDFINTDDVLSEKILVNLQHRWIDYLELIRRARGQLKGVFLIANPVSINSWICSANPAVNENKIIYEHIEKMNLQLMDLCDEIDDAHIIDISSLASKVGHDVANPGKYWYMARAPFSIQFSNSLSQHILGMMLALEGKTARVIALDLDNTLWKGVIGDDGISGIALGGDYPGNVYKIIQKVLKSFRERGIALVLCSKNTEEIAFEVFEKHPDMVINKDDLTSWRVNWLPKPQNIRDLSVELDLGLASFCFIDDNPLEREEMRMSVPEIFVPEMPADISDWPEYILNLPELVDLGLTDEDRKRVDQYKIRSEIKRGEAQAGSRDEFLKSLDMQMHIEPITQNSQQRIMQLIKKTNQFNVTTRRYSEVDLKNILDHGECFSVRLKDKFGSDEIVGVLILVYEDNKVRIDTLLLSCRVLGRGVETALLAWLHSYLLKNNCQILIGEIVPTERNLPVRDIYVQHGFDDLGNNFYELNLPDRKIDMPIWIKVR